MRLLVEKLSENDRVAIVVYAGGFRPGAAFHHRRSQGSKS